MNQPTLFDTAATPIKTFELSQKRKDGTLSSVTFIKAHTLADAEEIARPAMCTGEKVFTEIN